MRGTEALFDVLREVAGFLDGADDGLGVPVDLDRDFVRDLPLPVGAPEELLSFASAAWRIRDEIACKLLEILSSSVRTD